MDKSKKHKAQETQKEQENGQPGVENCECVCGDGLNTLKSGAPKNAAAVGDTVPPGGAKEPPDYYAQLVQLKADFENYRKRMEKERPSLINWGKSEAILRFLPLYDMLLAAHQHVGKLQDGAEVKQVEDVVKGLEMIFKAFSKVFEDEGIRPMEPVGKPYDPMATDILGVVDGDESNDGLVTEELQKGFYYGDKVLRPARVKIARKKAPPPAEETGEVKNEKSEFGE
ncbi:MAG: nucleotide exchange factor GrpE [Elusimicrobia bacterium]|nr:nucleotide exchange factor GrpE [Elusimicrobiota bacterium]